MSWGCPRWWRNAGQAAVLSGVMLGMGTLHLTVPAPFDAIMPRAELPRENLTYVTSEEDRA